MELDILKDIVIIFMLSTLVNFIFTKIRVPTIIGYLLTGIIAGPYMLKIIHSAEDMELMAEIGVILLMFTIGLEFSLNHLLKIRRIVLLGGFFQLFATAALTMLVARFYDLSWRSAVFVGLITALSSTAVVLKILQERSELTSNYGRTVLGILIFQDLILIPLLLITPILGGQVFDLTTQIFSLVVKTLVIIGIVYAGNRWVIPKLLHLIALTKNQELFFMSILLICLSVALFTSSLGMSLAFGAFLGGLMISGSEYSHNAFGNIIPFKDTFTSFFFVSIGMLLDVQFVVDHYILVILTVLLVIGLKVFIGGMCAFILGHTFKGTILVGLAIGQVGEFSFILARMGMDYQLMSTFYYQLFLAVAILSMSIAPFVIQGANAFADRLLKLPVPKILQEGLFPLSQINIPALDNHLVLIGKDSRSLNLSAMARYMKLPYLSVIFDPAIVKEKMKKGEMAIYGDALNEPILKKAHVDTAGIVVISIGDLITAMAVTEKVRRLNKHAVILVRTKHVYDIEELYKSGADQVIPEEFETAINLFERILKKWLLPSREIHKTIARIREDGYGIFREKKDDERYSVLKEIPNIEILAFRVGENSPLAGKSLAGVQFRKTFGVTILAIKRGEAILDHPSPDELFRNGDIVYIMGRPELVSNTVDIFTGS